MLYALLIGICSLLKNDDPGRKRGAIALVLAIVGLLTHEAFFFWGIPVVILALVRNKTTRTEGIVGLVIFAVIFAMTCIFKGSEEQARMIVESWKGFPGCENVAFDPRNSLGALGWDLEDTVRMHIRRNFSNGYPLWFVAPLRLFVALLVYYFLSNILFTFRRNNSNAADSEKTSFYALLLCNFVCMIPMFMFLSNDWGRLYQYVAISTFGAYITLSHVKFLSLFPEKVLVGVAKFNSCLEKIAKPKAWLKTVMLLLVTVRPWHFSPELYPERTIIGSVIIRVARFFSLL